MEAGWRDFPSRLPPWHTACPQMLCDAAASLSARCKAAEPHLAARGFTARPAVLHWGNSLPALFPKRGQSRSRTKGWVRPSPRPFSNLSQGLQVQTETVEANKSLRMREMLNPSAGIQVG